MSILGDEVERRPQGRPSTTVLPPESGEIQLSKWQSPTVDGQRIKVGYHLYEILIGDPNELLIYLELQFGKTGTEAASKAYDRVYVNMVEGSVPLLILNKKKLAFTGTELSGQFPTLNTLRALHDWKNKRKWTRHEQWQLQYTVKEDN
jgi:hypothetical protein